MSGFQTRFFAVVALSLISIITPSGSAWAGSIPFGPLADKRSGIAMDGLDVVSYFDPSGPHKGEDQYEAQYLGVGWRFANIGNYQEFLRKPKAYVPAYLGYSAYALAKGTLTTGVPLVYRIYGNRVYFFNTFAELDQWQREPDKHIALANQQWKKIYTDVENRLRAHDGHIVKPDVSPPGMSVPRSPDTVR